MAESGREKETEIWHRAGTLRIWVIDLDNSQSIRNKIDDSATGRDSWPYETFFIYTFRLSPIEYPVHSMRIYCAHILCGPPCIHSKATELQYKAFLCSGHKRKSLSFHLKLNYTHSNCVCGAVRSMKPR